MSDYITFQQAREAFEKAGLPSSSLWGLARAERGRANGDQKIDTVRGIRLRTRAQPGTNRLLYHAGDVRRAILLIREALDEGRTTTEPTEYGGDVWIPSLLVRKRYGFAPVTLLPWNAERKGTRVCPWTGRRLSAHKWLAKRPDGVLRWVWFYKESELKAAKEARDRDEPANNGRPEVKPKDRTYESPDPKLWADETEALVLSGARQVTHIFRWQKYGFLPPDGRRIYPKSQTFKVEGSRGNGRTFWWRDDLKPIGNCRKQLKPADDRTLAPVMLEGRKFQRKRVVLEQLGCSENVLDRWATFCPALGKPFERRLVPSLHSTRPQEWVYCDAQFQQLLAIPPDERTWGRGRTEAKPWIKRMGRVGGKFGKLEIKPPSTAPQVETTPGNIERVAKQGDPRMQIATAVAAENAPPGSTLDKVLKAIRLLKEDPSKSARSLAKEVGCSHPTLTNHQLFKDALAMFTGKPPRGFKTRDGEVEAFDG